MYSSMAGGMKRGGLVWFDDGGMVEGPGGPHSDSILIHASKGEYILPASAVRLPGVLPLLHKLREAGLESEGIRVPPPTKRNHFEYGGMPSWAQLPYEDASDFGDDGGGGGGGGGDQQQQQKKGGGGGYGGGLSGEAMQLRDRSTADQSAQWMRPTIIPTSGGGGWGMPTASAPMTRTGTMPQSAGAMAPAHEVFDFSRYLRTVYGPGAVPSNFGELPQSAQGEYAQMYKNARDIEASWGGPQNNPYE